MKDYTANEVRNVVVLGHSGSGKSTLIESVLYYNKQIDKFGKATDGTTAVDFDIEEGKREFLLTAILLRLNGKAARLTLSIHLVTETMKVKKILVSE